MAGLSLILPLLPRYVDQFSLTPAWMTVVIVSFPVFQLLFSPIWSWMSDRVGRRPILLLSTLGSSCAYLLLAVALSEFFSRQNSFFLLCLSRGLIGVFAGNLSVAILYVVEQTPSSQRTARLTVLEAALSLGLIVGPAIGGLAFYYGGAMAPAWTMALLQGLLFLGQFFFLSESLRSLPSYSIPERLPGSLPIVYSRGIRRILSFLFFFVISCLLIFEISFPLLVGTYRFEPWEIRRPYTLAFQIAEQNTPAGAALHPLVSPSMLKKLQHADQFPRSELQQILADLFNQWLRDPRFSFLPYWKQLKLPSAIQRSLSHLDPRSTPLDYRLNRFLLEAAFPRLLEPRKFLYSEKQIAFLFAYCGLLTLLTQLFIIKWSQRGERIPGPLFGLRLMGIGLGLVLFAQRLIEWLFLLAAIAIGGAFSRSPLIRLFVHCSPGRPASFHDLPLHPLFWGCVAGPFSAVYLQNANLYYPYLIPALLILLLSFFLAPLMERIY